MENEYKVIYVSPCRYEIVDSKGFAVYDDAPYGKDAPLFYRDYETALSAAEILNMAELANY
jgi:hypothetical protein